MNYSDAYRLILALCACGAVVAGCAAKTSSDGNTTTRQPVTSARIVRANASSEELVGLWKTVGFGAYVKVGGTDGHLTATTYEIAGNIPSESDDRPASICLDAGTKKQIGSAGDSGEVTFGSAGKGQYTLGRDGDGAVLKELGNLPSIRLTRQDGGLPAECAVNPPTSAQGKRLWTIDFFYATFKQHYYTQIPWLDQAWKDDYTAFSSNPDLDDRALFDKLKMRIEDLHDAHTTLSTPLGSAEGLREGTRPDAYFNDRKDAIEKAILARLGVDKLTAVTAGLEGEIDDATLSSGIGYLRVTTFDGFGDQALLARARPDQNFGDGKETFADDQQLFDAALAELENSKPQWPKGLILDLRTNGGGHDALGQKLAAALSGNDHDALVARVRDPESPGGFTEYQKFMVKALDQPYRNKVVILLSDATTSAAENTPMAMTNGADPMPFKIGRATQGAFSDELKRALPIKDWAFQVSNEDWGPAPGVSFERRGLSVDLDHASCVFEDSFLADKQDPQIDAAIVTLGGEPQPGGRPCR